MHILAINETKLDDSIDDALIRIDSYSIKRCERNRKGGGVGLYIKYTILDKCSLRNDLPELSLEALCLEAKSVRAAPFLIFSRYRPPNAYGDIFRQLEESMQALGRENKEIILLRDTNCDTLPNYLDGYRIIFLPIQCML